MTEMIEEVRAWSVSELHRMTMAHACSRADVSRQLAEVGRKLMELAAVRRTNNVERIRQSQLRVDRLLSWRTSMRERVRFALK